MGLVLPQHAVPMALWVCITLASQMRDIERTDYGDGLCYRLSWQLLTASFLSDSMQAPVWASVYL